MIYHKIENQEVVDTQNLTTDEFNNQEGLWVTEDSPEVVAIKATYKSQDARGWRDQELLDTDFWVPTTDHPQYSDRMAYRVALRNWPSTSDFPATKPTL